MVSRRQLRRIPKYPAKQANETRTDEGKTERSIDRREGGTVVWWFAVAVVVPVAKRRPAEQKQALCGGRPLKQTDNTWFPTFQRQLIFHCNQCPLWCNPSSSLSFSLLSCLFSTPTTTTVLLSPASSRSENLNDFLVTRNYHFPRSLSLSLWGKLRPGSRLVQLHTYLSANFRNTLTWWLPIKSHDLMSEWLKGNRIWFGNKVIPGLMWLPLMAPLS